MKHESSPVRPTELLLLSMLGELSQQHGCISAKGDFEEEGTRLDEAMRLRRLTAQAGLPLTMKIGGPGAVHDMQICRELAVDAMVAPMVETAYAAQKFLQLAQALIGGDADVKLWLNIETATACANAREILKVSELMSLTGVVVGRVDLAASLGLERSGLESLTVGELATRVLREAKDRNLITALGGGVSQSFSATTAGVPLELLDRVETRKMIFRISGPRGIDAEALALANGFEIKWLEYKKYLHEAIAHEDDARLILLQSRHHPPSVDVDAVS